MPTPTDSPFSFARFVSDLWDSGRVNVSDPTGVTESAFDTEELEKAEGILRLYERQFREHLPGDPPEWDSQAAMWALEMLYRACSFLLHRDASAEMMRGALFSPCPVNVTASVCYSVDLSFRFLPDLHRMVVGVSRNDPLCDFLEEWGIKWPLSSVGLDFRKPTVTLGHPGEETRAHPTPAPSQMENSSIIAGEISWDLCGFWEHATLRRLYLDRIIILKDLSRLSDVRVALEVREALGSYPSLVPDVARRLRETDNVIVASGNSNTVSNYLSFNPSLGESIAPPYNDSSR